MSYAYYISLGSFYSHLQVFVEVPHVLAGMVRLKVKAAVIRQHMSGLRMIRSNHTVNKPPGMSHVSLTNHHQLLHHYHHPAQLLSVSFSDMSMILIFLQLKDFN